MPQWLNLPAIAAFAATCVRSPRMFLPNERYSCLGTVDWRRLRGAGVRAVVFDKDNTLTRPYAAHIDDAAKVSTSWEV